MKNEGENKGTIMDFRKTKKEIIDCIRYSYEKLVQLEFSGDTNEKKGIKENESNQQIHQLLF